MLLDALGFPLRRDHAPFLGLGALLCSVPAAVYALLPGVPYMWLIGLFVEALVLCYVLLYFQAVLESSTRGDEHVPMWPDNADPLGLVGRAFHVIVPLALCFLPLAAFVVWRVFATGSWSLSGAMLGAAIGLFALGLFYLPIALLVFSFYGETAVVNVLGAVRSIARIGWGYFAVVGLLLALFGAYTALGTYVVRWPLLLSAPVGALLFFYCMMASMRAVGLLYARNREKLGWDSGV